jgi:hypothetical protein
MEDLKSEVKRKLEICWAISNLVVDFPESIIPFLNHDVCKLLLKFWNSE